jgi:hypothetical protein
MAGDSQSVQDGIKAERMINSLLLCNAMSIFTLLELVSLVSALERCAAHAEKPVAML